MFLLYFSMLCFVAQGTFIDARRPLNLIVSSARCYSRGINTIERLNNACKRFKQGSAMSNDASLANFGWKLWPQIKVYLARLVYSIYSRTIFTNGSEYIITSWSKILLEFIFIFNKTCTHYVSNEIFRVSRCYAVTSYSSWLKLTFQIIQLLDS